MTLIDETLPTIRHPKKRQHRFWSFSGLDWYWNVLVGVGAILTSTLVGGSFFWTLILTMFIAFWVWTMSVPSKSPRNDRRFMTPVYLVMDAYWKYIRNGVLWEASSKEVEAQEQKVAEEEDGTWKKRDTRIVKPFPLEVVELQLEDGTSIGLIYHQGKQTYSLVFKAPGSHFSSLSRLDQYFEIMKYASMIKKATATAGIKGLNIGVGLRSRPQDPWSISRMMLKIGDINAVLPSAVVTNKPESEYTSDDKQDVLLYKMQKAFSQIIVKSYSVDMMVVITVKQNAVLKKSSLKKAIDERQYRRLPIIRLMQSVKPMLDRLVGGAEILDLAGAEEYLCKAKDAATLNEFYDSQHRAWTHARRQDMGIEADMTPYKVTHDRYLPKRNITVGSDYLNMDGTYGAVLDMTAFQADEVYAHDAKFLYDAMSRWFSMSVIGKAARNDLSYFASSTSSSIIGDVADQVGKLASDPKSARKKQENEQRLEDMDREGLNMDFIIRFATLAESKDDLDDDIQLDFDRFVEQGLEPVRVEGYSQQLSKFLTTVTLIDCE